MSAARRIVVAVLFVATLPIALLAGALIFLTTQRAHAYVAAEAERRAEAALDADVSIGRLRGTLLFGATLEDVSVASGGEPVVTIDRVVADYSAFDFLAGRFDLRRIELERPVLHRDAFGLMGSLGDGGGGRQRRFAIDRVLVSNGRVTIGPAPSEVGGLRVPDVIRDLDAEVSLQAGPGETTIAVQHLSFTGTAPRVELQRLTGTVVIADGDLQLDDMKVKLAESSFEFGGTIENFRQLGD
jgi:uncharacterized protein involved in outer membrane biogenesis